MGWNRTVKGVAPWEDEWASLDDQWQPEWRNTVRRDQRWQTVWDGDRVVCNTFDEPMRDDLREHERRRKQREARL